MFDISWSELLILGLVTLIFVGPKELPRFLGTLGKYAGVVRRQANEFRVVFEQAMREAELDQIQKEVRAMSDGVKTSLDDATRSVESVKTAAKVDLDAKPAPTGVEAAAGEPAPSILPPAATVPPAEGGAASEPDPAKPAAANEIPPTSMSSTSTSGPV